MNPKWDKAKEIHTKTHYSQTYENYIYKSWKYHDRNERAEWQ